MHLYRIGGKSLRLVPGGTKREHFIAHAYHCQPLLDANRYGWDLVADEEIVIEGRKPIRGPAYEHFGMGTITVNVGYVWRGDVDLLIIPPPNQEAATYQAMGAIINLRECPYPWFLSIRMLADDFTIPAGAPLARVIPVSRDALHRPLVTAATPGVQETQRAIGRARDEAKGTSKRNLRWYHKRSPKVSVETPRDLAEVYVEPDFIDREEAAALRAAWDAAPVPPPRDDMWTSKVRWLDMGTLPERIHAFGRRIVPGCELLNPHLVRWKPGDKMPLHSDYGATKEFPEREWAVILYLNDDFEGGEIMLREGDDVINLRPETGMLIVHRGGRRYHGVSKVTAGYRYTAIAWLTKGDA